MVKKAQNGELPPEGALDFETGESNELVSAQNENERL